MSFFVKSDQIKFLKIIGIAEFVMMFKSDFLSAEPGSVEIQLISETETIQPGTDFSVGVYFQIGAYSHIYWKNPGDSGLPTTITWKLPGGFHAAEMNLKRCRSDARLTVWC